MSHLAQKQYFLYMKNKFPSFFKGTKVLDVGSLDINGSSKDLFLDCDYYGLDIAPGKNVDIISVAHEYNAPDESYEVIVSSNAFEHDMFFPQTLKNIIRLLKPRGLFFFSCPGEGHAEHGTEKTSPYNSPLTVKNNLWKNYYKNITEQWVKKIIKVEDVFSCFEFEYYAPSKDLRFWGIKK